MGSSRDGDSERRLVQAMGRSPGLAAMLGGRDGGDRPPRYRRLLLLVAGAALVIAVLWGVLAAVWPRPKEKHETAELDTSHYLSPLKTAAEPGTGEQTAPFAGFAISVETDPPGALVSVNGVPRGEAPVLAGVDCAPGARVEIRAEHAGWKPALAKTACRKDTLVKLTLRLAP